MFSKIDYGMPTLIELKNIEECISLAAELKLDFIEINMNMPQYQIEFINIACLKESVDKGFYFTFHLDENFNAADFNIKISNAYVETCLAVIEISQIINAPVINMHMAEGIHFTLPDRKEYLFQKYSDIYTSKLMEFRDKCDKSISDSKLKLCIENTDVYKPFMKQGIDLLLKSKNFGLTFDIGHDHAVSNADEQFIIDRFDRLYHMHIHDAIGKMNHLILGSGEIRLHEKITLAKNRNLRCVIETKTVQSLKESVKYLRKHDLGMIEL